MAAVVAAAAWGFPSGVLLAEAAQPTTQCGSPIGGKGASYRDVEVPSGKTCILLPHTRVTHDVRIDPKGMLVDQQAWVGHDIEANRSAGVVIESKDPSDPAKIGHNVKIEGTLGSGPQGNYVCNALVLHDVKIVGSEATAGIWTVGDSTLSPAVCVTGTKVRVGHDLIVQNNAAPIDVADTLIGDDLTIRGNKPGGAVINRNSVGDDASCADNEPFSASQNSANHDNTCSSSSSMGLLSVNVIDLPVGVAGSVNVSGPGSYTRHIAHSAVLVGLQPGTYTVTATGVQVGPSTYFATSPVVDAAVAPGRMATAAIAYRDIIPSTTKVLLPTTVLSVAGPPGGNRAVTVQAGPTGQSPFVAGDIIAVAVGPATPHGLLARVQSITRSGGTFVGSTVPATIMQAITRGSFTFNASPAVPPLPQPSPNATSRAARPAQLTPHAGSNSTPGFPIDNTLKCSTSASVSVKGSISVQPRFNFTADWGFLSLNSASFTASIDEIVQLAAAAEDGAQCSLSSTSILKAPIELGDIDIQVGPIPLIFTPELNFSIDGMANIKAGVATSITQKATATAGMRFENGSFSPVGEFHNSFDFQPPQVTGNANFDVYAGPDLDVLLYGVVGPRFNIDPGLKFDADISKLPKWWTLYGCLKAGASLAVSFLGQGLAYGNDSIFNTCAVIAEASAPPPPLTIKPSVLPAAALGQSYQASLAAVDAVEPLQWSVGSGALPPGIQLNTSTGLISGTAIRPGDYAFSISVRDARNRSATQPYTLTVTGSPPSITSTNLPGGEVNVPYSISIGLTGGAPPFSWIIISGQLPAGLSLDPGLGLIRGTPTTSGTSMFTVKVTDAGGETASQSLTLQVIDPAAVFREFPLPSPFSQPHSITEGPDHNMWFTEPGSNRIGRITPQGVLTEFPIPSPVPIGIVTGPDGRMWFTEVNNGKIGAITTSGVLTEYRGAKQPENIAVGPDGNLWFTDLYGNGAIGRITTSGSLTEFSITPPTLGSQNTNPVGITSANDGNLWFGEQSTGRIGRITPDGTITEFSIPGVSGPQAMLMAPDGSLWFVYGGGQIGQLTLLQGGVQLTNSYALGGTDHLNLSMAVGPDGNVWVADEVGTLQRVTLKGVVTVFNVPTVVQTPEGIAAGPNQTVWFTDENGELVGRLALSSGG